MTVTRHVKNAFMALMPYFMSKIVQGTHSTLDNCKEGNAMVELAWQYMQKM